MRDYSKITKPTPEKYCVYCGKKLERKFYNGRREDLSCFKRRKYCGIECMKRAFIKTDGYHSSIQAHTSARKIKYLIEERPKVCEICGSISNIDVHHKDMNYNNNNADNLMVVCRSCHMKLHKKKQTCIMCGRPAKGYGYCNMHYIRYKKYGDPLYYQGKIVLPTFTERKGF